MKKWWILIVLGIILIIVPIISVNFYSKYSYMKLNNEGNKLKDFQGFQGTINTSSP